MLEPECSGSKELIAKSLGILLVVWFCFGILKSTVLGILTTCRLTGATNQEFNKFPQKAGC